MSFRAWFREFNEKSKRSHSGPGEIFDHMSVLGNIRFLILTCAITYVLWHSYEITYWIESLFYDDPTPINPVKQRWSRLWALIIGGVGVLAAVVSMALIPIKRRRARQSVKGQWHDDPHLTKEDLYRDGEDAPPPSG